MNKKELYKAARDAGETYDAIAKRFGVSRQAVWSNLNGKRKPWQDITLAECIYPNLRGWMNDNRVSVPELAKRVTGDRDGGASVRKWIAGYTNPNKKNIDKLLSVTGLTYEQLWEKVESKAPTVDAVEVVRCKDCIHDNTTDCHLCWIENHTLQFINHDAEFFCGKGERKDNE